MQDNGSATDANKVAQSEPDSQDDLPIFKSLPRKRRAVTFISPTEIANIFPNITVEQLCTLSDVALLPGDVPTIVPEVSVDQKARFFQLIEKASLVPVALPAKQPVTPDPPADRIPSDETIIQTVFENIKELADHRYG